MVRFRPAERDDWPRIWEIFREVVAKGETYMVDPNIQEEEARTLWMIPKAPKQGPYIAEWETTIVGTCLLKPNQPGPGDHIANAAWMIDSAYAGRGVGRAFALYIMEEARARAYRGMQFNAVVATNARAIKLWESLGFETVGTVPEAFRHPREGLVSVQIMYRSLNPRARS